ncbi:MAG: hypothetical protein U0V74_01030 [Chitinophagales bacterium]
MRKLVLLLLPVLFIAACNKTEEVVIKDNIPPPDHTIDSTVIEIYVNKAYINILGREPIGNEKQDGISLLKQDNFSKTRREQFVNTLFANPEYNINLLRVARNEYLRGLDSLEVAGQIYLFQQLLLQPQYAPFYDVINKEIARLQSWQQSSHDLTAGTLDYKGLLKRSINNYFYDQINMGTENFVVSTYQNFLFRYPSDAELAAGKTMVDGGVSVVFLQQGQNKDDYIQIFFDSDDYYEGQVRYMFTKYLFREPTDGEIAFYSGTYKTTGDYQKLGVAVFSMDEYAGIK